MHDPTESRTFKDQTGRSVQIPGIPKRIVSVVPSQTELLYELGLEDEVCGITKFCVHPHKWFRSKTRVGGTKNLHLEKIRSLQPDLILSNKEENSRQQIETLAAEFPVWISNIHNLEEAIEMIAQIGSITGKEAEANQLVYRITENFALLKQSVDFNIPTACLIWKDPYMVAGSQTFIDDMMKRCGLKNVFSNYTRYPELSLEQIRDSGARLLILTSEPYPFSEKHLPELQRLLPGLHLQLADGEMFSWYGSRLVQSALYLQKLALEIKTGLGSF